MKDANNEQIKITPEELNFAQRIQQYYEITLPKIIGYDIDSSLMYHLTKARMHHLMPQVNSACVPPEVWDSQKKIMNNPHVKDQMIVKHLLVFTFTSSIAKNHLVGFNVTSAHMNSIKTQPGYGRFVDHVMAQTVLTERNLEVVVPPEHQKDMEVDSDGLTTQRVITVKVWEAESRICMLIASDIVTSIFDSIEQIALNSVDADADIPGRGPEEVRKKKGKPTGRGIGAAVAAKVSQWAAAIGIGTNNAPQQYNVQEALANAAATNPESGLIDNTRPSQFSSGAASAQPYDSDTIMQDDGDSAMTDIYESDALQPRYIRPNEMEEDESADMASANPAAYGYPPGGY